MSVRSAIFPFVSEDIPDYLKDRWSGVVHLQVQDVAAQVRAGVPSPRFIRWELWTDMEEASYYAG